MLLAAGFGIPVSTTHTITGATVGAARRVACVITLQMSAAMAGIFCELARLVR